MNLFCKIIFGDFPPSSFNENYEAICDINLKILKPCAVGTFIVYMLISLASLLTPSINNAFHIYFSTALLICAALIAAFSLVSKNKRYAKLNLYVIVVLVLLSTTVLGTLYQPFAAATAFAAAIAVFPSFILDRPLNVFILIISSTLLFCFLTLYMKSSDYAIIDTISAVGFASIGALSSHISINLKMSSITGQPISNARNEAIPFSDDIFFDYNPETNACLFSESAYEYFNMDLSIDSIKDGAYVYHIDKPKYEALLRELNSGNSFVYSELRFLTKTNEIVWFSLYAAEVKDASGSLRRIIGKLSDVNEKYEDCENIFLSFIGKTPIKHIFNQKEPECEEHI